MRRATKVVLIIFGCMVFAAGAAATAVYIFEPDFAALKAEGRAVNEDGWKCGSANDDVACLETTFERTNACKEQGGFDVKCGALGVTFFKACLRRARETDSLCASVPIEASKVDTAAWVLSACAKRSRSPNQRVRARHAGPSRHLRAAGPMSLSYVDDSAAYGRYRPNRRTEMRDTLEVA